MEELTKEELNSAIHDYLKEHLKIDLMSCGHHVIGVKVFLDEEEIIKETVNYDPWVTGPR